MENNTEVKVIDNKKVTHHWEKWRMEYFLSSYNKAHRFLIDQNYLTQNQINSGCYRDKIAGWDMEKKDWEKQALETTLGNLQGTKVVEMKNFIVEEGQVVKQLLNMAKVAMNDLITKTKNPITGKEDISLKNTQGFKQLSESVLNILKYGRDRLGISFDKEEEGMKNAINFNFDLVSLEDFDPEQVIELFKNKDAQQINKQSIAAVIDDSISETNDDKNTVSNGLV